ncbi:MAG: sulfite exporter TauE/SafE family protein [Legionella sp.]|nr:sulfite exporter TauE/SafE family protein [Legionella sp.]
MDFMYSVAGALTGFFVGLTGVGGGALMTPILLLIFGVSPTTAVATDLWFATITKVFALIIHHREQQIEWPIVRRLWMGSLPATSVFVIALLFGVLDGITNKLLPSIIGVTILITALGMLIKMRLQNTESLSIFNHLQALKPLQKTLTIIGGAMLGIMVSLTSIGAGALGSLLLIYLYPSRLTPHKLVGTDIAHAIPLALIAGLGYLISGHVNTSMLLSMLIGSIPAAIIGSLCASRFSQNKLRLCLVTILSISGLKLVFI